MKKRTYLVLGSCLLIQALPYQQSNGGIGQVSASAEVASVPLYHHEQARELLGVDEVTESNDSSDRSLSLALYVHSRTRDFLPQAHRHQAGRISRALIETANEYQMDPLLLMALIQQESRFNPTAIGGHGEVGLMQMKPSTAAWLIKKGIVVSRHKANPEKLRAALKDPVVNIAFGTAYLASLRTTFKNRGSLYLSAYNMGAGNVKVKLKNGERPRIYSDRVLSHYVSLSVDFATLEKAATKRLEIAMTSTPTFGL